MTNAWIARCLLPTLALAVALSAGMASAQLRLPADKSEPALRLPGSATLGSPGTPAAANRSNQTVQPPAPNALRGVDRVVAVVNKDAITLRELQRRTDLVIEQMQKQGVERPPLDVLQRQVLERMIVDRAQIQQAHERGLRVDDSQLERALANVAQDNGVTIDEMRSRVEAEGRSFKAFREDLREEILRARLREREVDSQVQVSEADIDAFLASQGIATQREGAAGSVAGNAAGSGSAVASTAGSAPAAPAGPVEYEVEHILVRVPETASSAQIDEARQRAEALRSQAGSGEDFGRLAASASDAPDALAGGRMGWRTADRLPELFAQAVVDLEPGALAPVLRSPAGFHVLKLVDRRQPGSGAAPPHAREAAEGPRERPSIDGPAVAQTRARHILIRPNELIDQNEATRRLAEIRERVLGGTADFSEMARQHSVDGSAGRGGDLGWIYPGDTVPEFERAMNALGPNEISEPIRTPFGVHIIQVLERRTDAASPERLRQRAREILRERRIEERYEDWLRQVRDNAYVEYKLDGN